MQTVCIQKPACRAAIITCSTVCPPPNKTPAQAFTPPAEKKMGKKWTIMYNRTGRGKHEVANFLNSYYF